MDFKQAANNNNAMCLPAGPLIGNIHWINSILNDQKAIYYEGMVVPQRVVFSAIAATAGDNHTLILWHEALKGGRHAYDFLGSWPQAVATANAIAPGQNLQYNLVNNQCGCEIGPPTGGPAGLDTICANLHGAGGFTAFADCPDAMGTVGGDDVAARVAAFEAIFGNRQVKIYGNAAFVGTPTLTFTGYTGSSDKTANYSLNWTSASTQIVIEFGGHLAITGPSGDPLAYPQGSGTISGAAYHFSLATLDGGALGNQDNQIQGSSIITPPSCIPPMVTNLGGGCGAPAPSLTTSFPIIGSYLTFYISSQFPNSQIVLGAQGPPAPPPVMLGGGCVLHVDPATAFIFDNFFTTGNGNWTSRFLVGNLPDLVGLSLVVQAAVLAPGGPVGPFHLTNGLLITFGECPPFCTSSKDGYAGAGPFGMIFDLNYSTVFPSGIEIGAFDVMSGNLPPNGLRWGGDAAGMTALKTFLSNMPGPSGALMQDAMDPTATFGGGSLALQAATLTINIGFSDAGVSGSMVPGFSTLIYQNYPQIPDSLSGSSIAQILAAANLALSGGPLPMGYTYDSLAALLENLNLSFDGCMESFFASKFLFSPL